jgi:hypothetical protein
MTEETYRLTPLGLFSSEMSLEQAKALERVIIDFLGKTGENALVMEDGHLHFATLQKDWD